METITGIEIYPMISFLLFFTFFVLMLVYILKADKDRMAKIATLPLDDQTPNTIEDEKE
jgi:cbb3-type cytochrome oxidase subunit 3